MNIQETVDLQLDGSFIHVQSNADNTDIAIQFLPEMDEPVHLRPAAIRLFVMALSALLDRPTGD